MKKVFFLASAIAASMSMMATVDFQYLPKAGEKNAAGTEYTTSDKVEVQANEQLCAGTNFTVYNAYKTTYKVVGMMSDTAYSHLTIGDVTVDFTEQRIQGQDNPTAGGANPVIEMSCPNAGACYKVDVQKDGYLYVAVKTTPNKQQFVFEGVVEQSGSVSASMLGFQYLSMSNNTSDKVIGNPNGAICVEYQGDKEYNYLQAPPSMPATVANAGSYSTNGVGVFVVKVFKDGSPYIIGTAGSKIMACGFGFSEAEVAVTAVGSKGIKTLKPDYKYEDNYEDVVLTTKDYLFTQDCSEAPVFLKAKIPATEPKNDSTNIWNTYTVTYDKDNNPTYKQSINLTAYVWSKDDKSDAQYIPSAKSGDYYVMQVDGLKKFNAILLAGKVSDITKAEAYAQTEVINNITASACYQIDGFDKTKKDQKCVAKALDCLTGEELTAIDQVESLKVSKKVIGADGQLQLIMADGTVYNVLGTMVK